MRLRIRGGDGDGGPAARSMSPLKSLGPSLEREAFCWLPVSSWAPSTPRERESYEPSSVVREEEGAAASYSDF